jgi:hypothetical protein
MKRWEQGSSHNVDIRKKLNCMIGFSGIINHPLFIETKGNQNYANMHMKAAKYVGKKQRCCRFRKYKKAAQVSGSSSNQTTQLEFFSHLDIHC